jgi:hypothetical protein
MMKIQFALKTAVIAAALAFSGASHAEIHYTNAGNALVAATGGNSWTGAAVQSVSVYDLTGTTLGDHILAFCIEPLVQQASGTAYTEVSNPNLGALFNDATHTGRDTKVKALFETQYASLTNVNADIQKTSRLAFQLALWELVADDGNIFGGNKYFSSTSTNKYVVQANSMLTGIDGYTLLNTYKYTTFNGLANGVASQDLISVSAVPEADTWAMLAAGLGLVGFMGRRKSRQAEKFAA